MFASFDGIVLAASHVHFANVPWLFQPEPALEYLTTALTSGLLCLLASAASSNGEPPRRQPNRKAQIEQKRRDILDRTNREVDEIWRQYLDGFCRELQTSIGAIYARYSTRHQDSISDQVRTILAEAAKLRVFVPREYIFFDLAVTGSKSRRGDLARLQQLLEAKKVGTLLLFSTSRLFRKVYRTLEFVDRVHRGFGIRCVFVTSGIDTDDAKSWEMVLQAFSMVDQVVATMYRDNIRAAQEGLFERQLVCGTISYGYIGQPVDGDITPCKKVRRKLAVNPETAPIVQQIFQSFTKHRLSVSEILRRLNNHHVDRLPPRCTSGSWTRSAVRRILANPRYRGLWQYGVTKATFVPHADYIRQRNRPQPLKEMHFPDLAIVDDATWFAAQQRLAKEASGNRGRRPADGNTATRPRLLNELFYCPEHNQKLYVGGHYGQVMICFKCQATQHNDRPLYSFLNRQVALELLCGKLASAIQADDTLVAAITSACEREAELLQRPDPKRLHQLTKDEMRLQKSIDFCQRNPGDTEEDLEQTAQALREFRAELNQLRSEKALIDQAQKRAVAVPAEDEVRSMLAEMEAILVAAATDTSEQNAGLVRQIIDLLTGGRIDLYQMGERRKYRGWLQGRFQLNIVSTVARKTLGFEPSSPSNATEMAIDFKPKPSRVKQSEIAFQWYQQDLLGKEIAKLMGVSKSRVSALLKSAFAARGLERPDGRGRRATLPRKQVKIPAYQKIAADAVQMAKLGRTNKDIAKALEVSPPTVVAALRHWSSISGLPVRNSRERRRALLPLARERYECGATLKLIAEECGYSPRGVKLALQAYYSELGLEMPSRGEDKPTA